MFFICKITSSSLIYHPHYYSLRFPAKLFFNAVKSRELLQCRWKYMWCCWTLWKICLYVTLKQLQGNILSAGAFMKVAVSEWGWIFTVSALTHSGVALCWGGTSLISGHSTGCHQWHRWALDLGDINFLVSALMYGATGWTWWGGHANLVGNG